MLSAWKKLLPEEPPEAAVATYIALVSASRNPFFYRELSVPDSIDGRFELIVLHLFLLQQRLLQEPAPRGQEAAPAISPRSGASWGGQQAAPDANKDFARHLSEEFFRDMDRSLREMGVMDTGLGKRIKKMSKAYHGHLQAYGVAFADNEALKGALARNLYGTVKEGEVAQLERMAGYMRMAAEQLAATPAATITSGGFRWPNPS